MRRRRCVRVCTSRHDNRVLALRIYGDDRNARRSAALDRNATCIDTIRLQISKHLLAEIIRADAADENALAGASRRGDCLVGAFTAGMERDARAKHRLAHARMPLARGDDIHINGAEDENAGHAFVSTGA